MTATCETCRWWGKRCGDQLPGGFWQSRPDSHKELVFNRCLCIDRPIAVPKDSTTTETLPIYTPSDFGCIHHQPDERIKALESVLSDLEPIEPKEDDVNRNNN